LKRGKASTQEANLGIFGTHKKTGEWFRGTQQKRCLAPGVEKSWKKEQE